jgi:hypothetical protein
VTVAVGVAKELGGDALATARKIRAAGTVAHSYEASALVSTLEQVESLPIFYRQGRQPNSITGSLH